MHGFVDCQGLGGHWSLGTCQAGFEMVGRVSLGQFGDKVVETNRHLLPGNWEQYPGEGAAEWEPLEAAFVCGTPPCSGFSLLNNSAAQARKAGKDVPATARGADSSINSCMKELIKYAGLCYGTDGIRGAQIVSFESVQGAFSAGRGLMQALRAMLEEDTGQKYDLFHVKMSGSSVGAAQMRHRFFPVFARIPFGVEHPEPHHVATYEDAIGDLRGLKIQWESQVSKLEWSDWAEENGIIDTECGMDVWDHEITAHVAFGEESRNRQIFLQDLAPYWVAGHGHDGPLRAYYLANGRFPEGAERWWDWDKSEEKGGVSSPVDKMGVRGGLRGFSGPRMILMDRPGYVLTGGGMSDFIHPEEMRFLSARECSRLMGLPDSWSWEVAKTPGQASNYIGKCCPVQSGKWISGWVHEALDGNAPANGGDVTVIGEREFLHDNTLDYKRWDPEVSGYDFRTVKGAR